MVLAIIKFTIFLDVKPNNLVEKLPWWWMQQAPLKCRYASTRLHGGHCKRQYPRLIYVLPVH